MNLNENKFDLFLETTYSILVVGTGSPNLKEENCFEWVNQSGSITTTFSYLWYSYTYIHMYIYMQHSLGYMKTYIEEFTVELAYMN